jgi:hypothetical protein
MRDVKMGRGIRLPSREGSAPLRFLAEQIHPILAESSSQALYPRDESSMSYIGQLTRLLADTTTLRRAQALDGKTAGRQIAEVRLMEQAIRDLEERAILQIVGSLDRGSEGPIRFTLNSTIPCIIVLQV